MTSTDPIDPYRDDLSQPHINWTVRLAELRKYVPTRARLTAGAAQGLMSAFAAIIAYLPTRALGLREGFWGSITAIAVLQGELSATRSSARDQFAGAAIGGLTGALVVTLAGTPLWAYAVAVTLSMVVSWVCNVASAARLAGITATIILLVPHTGSVESMMLSRIIEVGWGVAVAIATVWAVNRIEKALRPRERPRA